MAKLNPPYIEGKLPAQVGNTLTIPFEHSQTRPADLSGIKLRAKIKTVNTNKQIGKALDWTIDDTKIAEFTIMDSLLTVGQFYKIQLCYLDRNEEGYYSTVGVFKYTSEPIVQFKLLDESDDALTNTVYLEYSNPDDVTELLYSVNYAIKDVDGVVIKKSDTNELFIDVYPRRSYTIECIYRTINNYIGTLSMEWTHLPLPTKPILNAAVANYDEGYIDITITGDIWRTEETENTWVYLGKNTNILRDYSVEQGKRYRYSNGIKYTQARSGIYADFEDSFLTDKNGRQLKIRFNPKVSSFKTTILETKTDTIGAKYPFFFRNGNVSYKEIPISGLISLLMDDNHLFMGTSAQDSLTRPGTNAPEDSVIADLPHNLSSNNIRNEREFKLAVLDWLNNGEPKLFRSPTEGNYVVRLMNVTLQPNDTLGRMLHTFSATGYEVEEDKGGFVYELPKDVSQTTE